MTGKEVEKLLGHLVSILLLRRELLAVLSAAYLFVSTSYGRRQPLWARVKAESRTCLDLLPTVVARKDLPWFPQVLACDASMTGYGVCMATWDPTVVTQTGGMKERARLRGPMATTAAPRCRALGKGQGAGDGSSQPSVRFLEVDTAHVLLSEWRVVAARRWRRRDRNLEAVALVWGSRSLGRGPWAHNRRHLVLGDNMAVVCAASKGRAAHFPLLRACRALAATSIACSMRVSLRWLPSEINPADAPSRRFETSRISSATR